MRQKTMNDLYGDSSNHIACEKCGFCITCGDCKKYGCRKEYKDTKFNQKDKK